MPLLRTERERHCRGRKRDDGGDGAGVVGSFTARSRPPQGSRKARGTFDHATASTSRRGPSGRSRRERGRCPTSVAQGSFAALRCSPLLAFGARARRPRPGGRAASAAAGHEMQKASARARRELAPRRPLQTPLLRICDGRAPPAAWRERARSDPPPIRGMSALHTSTGWPTLRASHSRW
jgi:hypothetical protein